MADESIRSGVIGHPITHSRSPLIHGNWIAEYGIDGAYNAYDVSPADLSGFLRRVRGGELAGCNVTIPHKEAMLEHIDELTDTAEAIGAVNTIWREADRLLGDNTDAYGFLANLDHAAPGWDENPRCAVVLGAGGAALAVLHGLLSRGFADIRIANRTAARAERLAARFGGSCHAMDWAREEALYSDADFVVNTTSLTMGNETDQQVWSGLDHVAEGATVTDIVYSPLQTSLLKAAQRRDLPTVDGLGMLLHQAVPSFERWFGTRPEVTPGLRRRVEEDLAAGH
ncbi:shikimate dehydrogenase [Notoacmeibacter ruber]|uniref:Shikimate dehydrogenase (NADP(+)) n=1 Tax=Notoacmeibacter ruber TaxID=2670375 RepID=A0A3L7JHQ1_9HYPH|nr:shikimate dehydrogenase [Notoacmeibacter ruber]RLQ89151.1 shikimate dehydrogenase [Notoacmeibacter ruber]